jgi:hypothetical protein
MSSYIWLSQLGVQRRSRAMRNKHPHPRGTKLMHYKNIFHDVYVGVELGCMVDKLVPLEKKSTYKKTNKSYIMKMKFYILLKMKIQQYVHLFIVL